MDGKHVLETDSDKDEVNEDEGEPKSFLQR